MRDSGSLIFRMENILALFHFSIIVCFEIRVFICAMDDALYSVTSLIKDIL